MVYCETCYLPKRGYSTAYQEIRFTKIVYYQLQIVIRFEQEPQSTDDGKEDKLNGQVYVRRKQSFTNASIDTQEQTNPDLPAIQVSPNEPSPLDSYKDESCDR